MLYAAFDANVGLSAYFCSLGFAANFAGNVLQHNTAADLWELAIQSAEPAALNTRTRRSRFELMPFCLWKCGQTSVAPPPFLFKTPF